MGYFRNPEIKKEGIIWLFAVLLTAFLGWYLASVRGLYLCLFCAVISVSYTHLEYVGMSCKKSGGLLLCNDRSGAETTGSFSAHTATHSTSESAHET